MIYIFLYTNIVNSYKNNYCEIIYNQFNNNNNMYMCILSVQIKSQPFPNRFTIKTYLDHILVRFLQGRQRTLLFIT